MINLLKEKLDERGLKYDSDSIDVRYSLSYSQGDGFMFLGTFYDTAGCPIAVKHEGRYYHKYSREIIQKKCGEYGDDDAPYGGPAGEEFKQMYEDICDEMEIIGYEHIDESESAEAFGEQCEANGWTFEEDGTMRNA
jgi:hypothetical protein